MKAIYQSSNLLRIPCPIIPRYDELPALNPYIMRSPVSLQCFRGFLVGYAWLCAYACVCMCTCTHECAHVCVVCVTGEDQSMWEACGLMFFKSLPNGSAEFLFLFLPSAATVLAPTTSPLWGHHPQSSLPTELLTLDNCMFRLLLKVWNNRGGVQNSTGWKTTSSWITYLAVHRVLQLTLHCGEFTFCLSF